MTKEDLGACPASPATALAPPSGVKPQEGLEQSRSSHGAAPTPAPWRISVDPKGFLCIRTGERNEHPDSDLIAEVYCGGANAHLIAAAPELYDALEKLVAHLNDRIDFAVENEPERIPVFNGIVNAITALAKARGEVK